MLKLPLTGTVIPATRAFLVMLPAIVNKTNAAPIRSVPAVIHREEIGCVNFIEPKSPLFLFENISGLNNGGVGRVALDSALNGSLRKYLFSSSTLALTANEKLGHKLTYFAS